MEIRFPSRLHRQRQWFIVGSLLLFLFSAASATAQEVVATIPLEWVAYELTFTPDAREAWVLGPLGVTVIDTAAEKRVTTIPIGGRGQVAFTQDGSRAYDTAEPYTVRRIPLVTDPSSPTRPWDIVIGHNDRAYASLAGDFSLAVIDTQTEALIANVPVGGSYSKVTLSPDERIAYVAGASGRFKAFDTGSNNILWTLETGASGSKIALTPDGRRALVTDRFGNSVKVIDTNERRIIATVPAGPRPLEIEIEETPNGLRAYVMGISSHEGPPSVSILDLSEE